MKERRYGRIVLISSIGGRTGRPGVGVNYAAAKGGIVGMTQLLGFELGPWNITVNCVAPGPIGGGMFASLPAENREKLLQGILSTTAQRWSSINLSMNYVYAAIPVGFALTSLRLVENILQALLACVKKTTEKDGE